MTAPNHDTSPITEEDLAPAEGQIILVADPAQPGTERQVVSFWHMRLDENQPPDFVGTLEEIEEFRRSTAHLRQAVVFDTSDLTRSPSGHTPTWRDRQRHLDQKLQPRVLHEQWTSRKDRRAKGDRRTAQQIAESIRSGQERS